MTFEEALKLLKQGACVTRDVWGDHRFIYMSRDGDIFIMDNVFRIWCNTQADLLAEDWSVYRENRR